MHLYTPHPAPLSALFSEVERFASEQQVAFPGAPGSVLERTNAGGFRFYAHQTYGADGKRHEGYVAGPVGDADADRAAADLRDRIAAIAALRPSLRLLGREGFAVADTKAFATVAALHNRGLFRAGAVLVGSHAYGALLNGLGIRAAAYATHDVDVARARRLALDDELYLLEALRETGLPFVEVPSLDARRRPSTSWKERGRSSFRVDLLAPSPDESYPIVAAPELHAHATGLPYLGFLVEEAQPGAVMTRDGCCAVRLPTPERFAVHKLVVSQLRDASSPKASKDIEQACVLAAAVSELAAGALGDAVRAVPKRAHRHLRAALPAARKRLAKHERALLELDEGA